MSEQGKRAHGEGTIERRGARVYAKVPKSDGSRPRIPLGTNLTDEAARAKLDAFLDRGRETGKLDAMIDRLLEKNARTRRGKVVTEKKLTTVREIGEAWLGGELFEKHGAVNGLRPSSMEHNTNGYNSNAVLNKRAYSLRTRGPQGPLFGDLLAADVSHEDIAKIMALQTGAAAGTRNHLHSYLSRIFSIAEIPLGLRTPGTSPVLSAYRARKDPAKLYNFLYPPEILALLRNVDVPLGRRVLYLLATYFGWRKGTLFAFTWSGVDWKHGTVSALHQKGHQRLDATADDVQGTPIFFRVEPACVLDVLLAWWEQCGRPGGDQPVIRDLRGAPCTEEDPRPGRPKQFEESWEIGRDEADILRRDLKASGVSREILFSKAKNVQAIRFHDGRATFCTWARRAGKSDLWITERTGHTPTTDMLGRYTRMAQMLTDLDYDPFPCVLHAIPELAPSEGAVCKCCGPSLSTSLSTSAISASSTGVPSPGDFPLESLQCEGGDSNPHRSYPTSTSS